jgi:hypothetical protein
LFALTLIGGRAAAQTVAINTDALTINNSSTSFNGFAMTAQNVGGVARFTIYGDFIIASGTLTITGSRPLSIVATNNVTVGAGVVFSVSGMARM